MKQYKVNNLDSKSEINDILQVSEKFRENKQSENSQRQEDIER